MFRAVIRRNMALKHRPGWQTFCQFANKRSELHEISLAQYHVTCKKIDLSASCTRVGTL